MAGESARYRRVRTAISNLVQLGDDGPNALMEYREMSTDDKFTVDTLAKNLINLWDGLNEKPEPAKSTTKKGSKR
jgi:hypothetical protein